MSKELKKSMRMMNHQVRLLIEIINNEPNRNSGVEKYNSWDTKFTRGPQQQIWTALRKNQQKIGQVSNQRNKRKKMKNEQSFRELWNTIQHTKKYITAVSGQEKKDRKNIWKKNSWKLLKCDEKQ